jgi:hypothetical protein
LYFAIVIYRPVAHLNRMTPSGRNARYGCNEISTISCVVSDLHKRTAGSGEQPKAKVWGGAIGSFAVAPFPE